MAQVPTYDNFQVAPTTTPQARFDAPQVMDVVGRNMTRSGEAAQRWNTDVARVALDMQNEANQIRVNDAVNRAKAAELRLTYDPDEGFINLKGELALNRPNGRPLDEETTDAFDEQVKLISSHLGNDAQRLAFTAQAQSIRTQLTGRVQQHVAQQFVDYSIGVQQGTVKTAQEQMSLAWGDPKALEQSRNAIRAATVEEGRLRGWSAKQVEAVMQEQLSRGHETVVMQAVQAGRTQYASDYLKEFSTEIDGRTRVRLAESVRQVSDVQRGEVIAEDVWSRLGPKDTNDPVSIFQMESAVREKFRDDPTAMKAGIEAVRQRAQAWNAQQTEFNAANMNAVYGLLGQGASMTSVRKSAAWLALPEKTQREIELSLESQAMARDQREWYRSGRSVQELQRKELETRLKTGAAYLIYSDPEQLSRMSRSEVLALRPQLGQEQTDALLRKHESLSTAEGRLEAKMDTDDFNAAAARMGIDPFKKNATAEHKGRVGELRYRIEQMIDQAQKRKGKALTREEKLTLVNEEMARTVTIDPGFFRSNREVPVITLSSEELKQVVVPPADRQTIARKLQELYKKDPSNPLYAPTEANIRRHYVQSRSASGQLIPNDNGR